MQHMFSVENTLSMVIYSNSLFSSAMKELDSTNPHTALMVLKCQPQENPLLFIAIAECFHIQVPSKQRCFVSEMVRQLIVDEKIVSRAFNDGRRFP